MDVPDEWPSRRGNPPDRTRLTGRLTDFSPVLTGRALTPRNFVEALAGARAFQRGCAPATKRRTGLIGLDFLVSRAEANLWPHWALTHVFSNAKKKDDET